MFDVDHFESINDRCGHMVGDEALRQLARTLDRNTRSYDFVGRWDGEEFLVVLPGTTLAEGAALAERLRASVATAPSSQADQSRLELCVSGGAVYL